MSYQTLVLLFPQKTLKVQGLISELYLSVAIYVCVCPQSVFNSL